MSPANFTRRPKVWTPPAGLAGSARIAAINDHFRTHYGDASQPPVPGRFVITRGVYELPLLQQFAITGRVRVFNDFGEDNDPNGEHEFAAFDIDGLDEKVFWKIDVYADAECEWGAEDPGDPVASYRLLTILLASEY